MPSLANIMAQAGALDSTMLSEFQKWRLPMPLDSTAEVFEEASEAIEAIEEALESREAVEVRATDLNVLKQYMETQTRGRLRIKTEDEDQTFVINFGVTLLGGVLIPWQSDSLEEFLTNGDSYLLYNSTRYFFSRVEDLFFGDRKVFILCTTTEAIRHDKD